MQLPGHQPQIAVGGILAVLVRDLERDSALAGIDVAQGNAGGQLLKIEVIQVGQEMEVRGFGSEAALAVKAQADVRRHGDGGDGVVQVHVVGGDGVAGQLGEMQAGVDEFSRVGRAVGLIGLAAFHGHRRAQLTHCHGLHAPGADEIDHGAGKQGGEMEEAAVEPVDAAIVRIQAGIVVHVDAGEYLLLAQQVDDLPHHPVFGTVARAAVVKFPAGPAAVVVRLTIEPALAVTRGGDVADKQDEGARQRLLRIVGQHGLDRRQAGGLIAVQQHRHKQGLWPTAWQADEGRTGQDAIQLRGRAGQQAVGDVVKDGQHGLCLKWLSLDNHRAVAPVWRRRNDNYRL